jgi:FMN hydrolase / 5-amino-6-(5-phospho-D-ribitylamino)uracil phosphatase
VAAAFSSEDFKHLRAQLALGAPERAHDLSWLRTETLRRALLATGYAPALARDAFEVFLAERNRIEPYADVRPALERMARRVPLFALSNGNACVQRVGLGHYFRGALGASSALAAKPDARIFAQLAALAAVEPGAILHVGDDAVADVAGARAAGLATVWVNRSGESWPEDLQPADHEVSDLAALASLVEALS